MIKIGFKISQWSQIASKRVVMFDNSTYEIDSNDLQEAVNEAISWAASKVAGGTISDVKVIEHNGIDTDSYIEEDNWCDYVNEECACDPDYQGEEGLMRAYEEKLDETQEVEIDGRSVLVLI